MTNGFPPSWKKQVMLVPNANLRSGWWEHGYRKICSKSSGHAFADSLSRRIRRGHGVPRTNSRPGSGFAVLGHDPQSALDSLGESVHRIPNVCEEADVLIASPKRGNWIVDELLTCWRVHGVKYDVRKFTSSVTRRPHPTALEVVPRRPGLSRSVVEILTRAVPEAAGILWREVCGGGGLQAGGLYVSSCPSSCLFWLVSWFHPKALFDPLSRSCISSSPRFSSANKKRNEDRLVMFSPAFFDCMSFLFKKNAE